MHNIVCITQICLFSLFSSLQEDLCLWEGLACCLCSFITLLYLEFVVKQDVKILSPLGLFNPPQPIRTVIRISQIALWESERRTNKHELCVTTETTATAGAGIVFLCVGCHWPSSCHQAGAECGLKKSPGITESLIKLARNICPHPGTQTMVIGGRGPC